MNMTKIILTAVSSVMLLNSCTQYQTQGAGIGALAGGAIGALAGDRHDALRGAALGAAVGTGVAAMQESSQRQAQAEDEYYRRQENGSRYDRAPQGRYEGPEPAPARQEYPLAKRTNNPHRVISPYSPYNVIDIEGFRSGQLARDPSNQKIFRVP